MSNVPRIAGKVAKGIVRVALRTVLLVVVPLAAVAVGVYIYAESGRHVTTENAYIKSNVVGVSADVSGRVEWVGVDDHTLVREGQVLFRLDQRPFKIALERAEAELALVRTQVEELRADYHEALAAVAAEEERISFLTRQLARQQTLKERKLASEQAWDVAAHDLSFAKRQTRVLRQRVRGVLQSLGGDPRHRGRGAPELPSRTHRSRRGRDGARRDLGQGFGRRIREQHEAAGGRVRRRGSGGLQHHRAR